MIFIGTPFIKAKMENLRKMMNIEDKTSTGECISLDDKHFINCSFKNCTLVYSGADYAMTNTKLENCPITFAGAAQRTVALLGMMGVLKAGAPVAAPLGPVQ
jgi:hypothetical protein